MASLGIYHWNKDNKSGLDASIASFRKYHPNAPYFVACDAAGGSQYDICKKYNVNYLHADFDLGYPSPHWGFDKLRVYIVNNKNKKTKKAKKQKNDIYIILNNITYYDGSNSGKYLLICYDRRNYRSCYL